jgi:putative transposase
MIVLLRYLLGWVVSAFRSRKGLVLENLALRQQLLALHAKRPRRRLTALHKLFWVALRTFWSGWTKPLVLVTPRTVVSWHRAGFRLYWAWVSRARQVGRKQVSKEVRALIFRMIAENPTWGAPRIHGELVKLGFDLSERSVSRWVRRFPRDPDPSKRWLTFLRNHREAIAAMDFFTVPTLTFGVLYCFFVIGHDRRKILHFNVTRNPKCSLDCAAIARSVGLQTAAPILAVRPRLKVRSRCGFGGKGHRKPANPPCLSQSVAERCR